MESCLSTYLRFPEGSIFLLVGIFEIFCIMSDLKILTKLAKNYINYYNISILMSLLQSPSTKIAMYPFPRVLDNYFRFYVDLSKSWDVRTPGDMPDRRCDISRTGRSRDLKLHIFLSLYSVQVQYKFQRNPSRVVTKLSFCCWIHLEYPKHHSNHLSSFILVTGDPYS